MMMLRFAGVGHRGWAYSVSSVRSFLEGCKACHMAIAAPQSRRRVRSGTFLLLTVKARDYWVWNWK